MLVGSSPMAAGVAVGLMLPAVQAARDAARRSAASNNLKQIALAMLNYESARKRLPSPAICDNTGKPLLSWRVAILPFLDESNLYQQFRRDEPWDSEHNKKLLLKMPPSYRNPDAVLAEGHTVYMLPVGENTLFPSADTGPKLIDIRDGTSKTLLAVETTADRAVPWTKPDDFEIDLKNPLAGLAGARSGGFLAVFVDGHVSPFTSDTDLALLRALLSPAGDEAVDPP
jgi:type II secretory pathway pseudopilin PulG